MPKLKKLPIGISSFTRIREDGYLYVDKTRHIFRMVDQGMFYFMSRPRRFGKSLTVSTLRCLFQGKKELFKGLWAAEQTDFDWKEHPVILIDFNEVSHDTPENLKQSLHEHLLQAAIRNQIQLKSSLLKNRFKELILSLSDKTGSRVVILIDEYDKPLIDHLGKGRDALKTAEANRDVLRSFLGVIKGGDVSSVLRFVFITGVSKFSRVSIFSELNNLDDLTMNRAYADFMGYTQEELESCFSGYIERLSKQFEQGTDRITRRLQEYYDGYRFSEKDVRVYNPFSVLRALSERAFKNYWFETGTPTFLVNLLKEAGWNLPKIEDMKAGEGVFSTFDLNHLKPEALLFQTGYVTIKDVREQLYIFGYPNREVKTAFLEVLFHSCTEGLQESSLFLELAGHLRREDFESFIETISAIFSSIPYSIQTKRDEAYFHTLFYLMVCASGVDVRAEVLTCEGRIDLVMEFPEKVFIIEFKCNQNADVAIRQIQEKGYDNQYRPAGKKLILMGINFDTEKRNVADWKIV